MDSDNLSFQNVTRAFYLKRVWAQYAQPEIRLSALVGWSSDENQLSGFEEATNLKGVDWKEVGSVLDIGCGYGALSDFLRHRKGFTGKYYGIELMPEFIKRAQSTCAHEKNSFLLGDFFEHDWDDQQFDVVISLGIISVNFDQPEDAGSQSLLHAEKSIAKMLTLSRKALSFYFPNRDYATDEITRKDIAYFPIDAIEKIIQANLDPSISYSISPYPGPQDKRTMVKILF